MNKRRAVALRRIVFAETDPAIRKYVKLKSTGQIIQIGDVEEIRSETGAVKKLPKRKIYQHLKKVTRGVPIHQLGRVICNENPKTNNNSGPHNQDSV